MNNEEQQRKDLLDPITPMVGTGVWFVLKSALSAIIGFLALEWFKKTRDCWKEEDEANNQQFSKEEQIKS